MARRCSTGTASTVWTTPAPSARCEQQYVAPFEVRLGVRGAAGAVQIPVQQGGAGEARRVAVDGAGERGLAGAGRHVRAGDGDPAFEPDGRVAGEEQVGQRRGEEAVRRREPGYHPAVHVEVRARAEYFLVRESGGEHLSELIARQRQQMVAQDGRERRPDLLGGDGLGQPRVARGGDVKGGGQQLEEVEPLDAVAAQRSGEAVVLVLGPLEPRDAVEEQFHVVAGGKALELIARPVQQDRAQPPDLGRDAVYQ